MTIFLQILFVNLVVSCDNIGVIALATRHLPPPQAKTATRIGVGLSLVLKLAFIGIIGYLFNISWLHIRIIGGLLLIYVVHNMLKESNSSAPAEHGRKRDSDSFMLALVSIIATDISMSLDNVIAILSIVSKDGTSLDTHGLLMICASLLVSVPILLWCSSVVSKLMNRFPVLTYICAGYLFYTAITMICEDEMIALLLESINFTLTTTSAIIAGVGIVAASIYINQVPSPAHLKSRKRLVRVYVIAALDALITLALMGYLSTNPVHHGLQLSAETFFHFSAAGANGLYTIGRSPHLLALCACLIVAIMIGEDSYQTLSTKTYLLKLKKAIGAMVLFLLIDVLIASLGLTLMFGFGTLAPTVYFGYLGMQLALFSSYISIFCMFKIFIRRRSVMIIASMAAIHIELELVELFMFLGKWPFFTGYIPGRYAHNIPQPIQSIDPAMLYRILLCAAVCIAVSTWVGCLYCARPKPRP